MALPTFGSLWALGRKVEELFELSSKINDMLVILDARMRHIEDRLLVMESEQRQVITEARGAAASAATMVAAGALFEAATRITGAEQRIATLEQTRIEGARRRTTLKKLPGLPSPD